MLINQGDSTLLASPADVICILKLPAGTFHVAFFEEHPMPGPIRPIEELDMLRLKSKMHHTEGAPTLEGALEHVREMREQLIIEDANVMLEEAIEVDDPTSVWLVPNWTNASLHFTLKDALLA